LASVGLTFRGRESSAFSSAVEQERRGWMEGNREGKEQEKEGRKRQENQII